MKIMYMESKERIPSGAAFIQVDVYRDQIVDCFVEVGYRSDGGLVERGEIVELTRKQARKMAKKILKSTKR